MTKSDLPTVNVVDLVTFLDDYASRVGLDSKDLLGLLDEEDDWTVVVKTSALLEGVLNQSILSVLRPAELWEALERSGLDRKAQWAEKCGRITMSSCKAIRAVAPIRNAVVHDVTAFRFSFAAYFAARENQQVKINFARDVSAAIELGRSGPALDVCKFPSIAMWRLVLLLLQQVEKPLPAEQTSLDRLVRQLIVSQLEGPAAPATSPHPASNEGTNTNQDRDKSAGTPSTRA